MKTKALTETNRAVTVVGDDGRYAARVVMLSTLFFFAFIFLLLVLAQ